MSSSPQRLEELPPRSHDIGPGPRWPRAAGEQVPRLGRIWPQRSTSSRISGTSKLSIPTRGSWTRSSMSSGLYHNPKDKAVVAVRG